MKIEFLTLNRIIDYNKKLEYRTKHNKKIYYVNRTVPPNAIEALYRIPDCAEKYYLETEDLILTAAFYLKNIIVLQALEDGNHRTAIYVTAFFLKSNGYNIKKINDKCYLTFKERLIMWREKDYHTIKSLNSRVLKFEDNISTEESYVFNFCLKFIKEKML